MFVRNILLSVLLVAVVAGGWTVPARAVEPLSAAAERALKPGDGFRECSNCPEMLAVPAGSFTMGSPENEGGRMPDEGPQHGVTIARPFAVGKFEVTVDQFAAFVKDTGYEVGSGCWTLEGDRLRLTSGRSFSNPGFPQTGSHPAVCISWDDAKAYVSWLSRQTRKSYRLLTEAEFEYGERARSAPGAAPRFQYGDDETVMCGYGNVEDLSFKKALNFAGNWPGFSCDDGYPYTAPVGTYASNAFGLYDMQGNVWEWTEDCYHDTYDGAPADGSAWTAGDCGHRVLRGGGWKGSPGDLRAAVRIAYTHNIISLSYVGFRVARTLTP